MSDSEGCALPGGARSIVLHRQAGPQPHPNVPQTPISRPTYVRVVRRKSDQFLEDVTFML